MKTNGIPHRGCAYWRETKFSTTSHWIDGMGNSYSEYVCVFVYVNRKALRNGSHKTTLMPIARQGDGVEGQCFLFVLLFNFFFFALRSVRSVRSKLVREGVYVAAPKKTARKTDEPTKKELLIQLESVAPFPVTGFMGATKEAINDLIGHFNAN